MFVSDGKEDCTSSLSMGRLLILSEKLLDGCVKSAVKSSDVERELVFENPSILLAKLRVESSERERELGRAIKEVCVRI